MMDLSTITHIAGKLSAGIYPYFVFLGAMTSIIFLVVALVIYHHFRRLQCDRVLLNCHLMLALVLRGISQLFISAPLVFNVRHFYRKLDTVCKLMISFDMYTAASVLSWSFVQGLYLHCRIYAKIINSADYFKAYYFLGWVVPFVLVAIVNIGLVYWNDNACWDGYTESIGMTIMAKYMLSGILITSILLINTTRVFLTSNRADNEGTQFKYAVITCLLSTPILATNYYAMVHNPIKDMQGLVSRFHTVIWSIQGMFMAIMYCFWCSEVKEAVRKEQEEKANEQGNRRRRREAKVTRVRLTNREKILPPELSQAIIDARTKKDKPVKANKPIKVKVQKKEDLEHDEGEDRSMADGDSDREESVTPTPMPVMTEGFPSTISDGFGSVRQVEQSANGTSG